MRAPVLLRYLVGDRKAIEAIARSPWSIAYGAVFVLSAALAREYDGHDLVHEPWRLLEPFGASLISATVLFMLIHFIACFRVDADQRNWPNPLQAWRVFMSLFWMTAPLAWFYAIPYERFLSAPGAVEANLWTLAVVATWRVLLITRAISVLYGVNVIATFFIVMVFADAVVFTVTQIAAVPVIDLMGGIRYTTQERLLASAAFLVTTLSVFSAPVWIIGGLASISFFKPRWLADAQESPVPHHGGLGTVAALAIIVPLFATAFTQSEQIHKREAERLLRTGQVAEAFAMMSRFAEGEFPPHWDPPPRLGRNDRIPDLESVHHVMLQQWPADWVARIYLDKMHQAVLQNVFPYSHQWGWPDIVKEELGESLRVYQVKQVAAHSEMIEFLRDRDPDLTAEDRRAIDLLLARVLQDADGSADH